MKTKLFITLAGVLFWLHSSKAAEVNYELSMPEPHTHYFEVKMNVQGMDKSSFDLKMPVWAPGSYLVREFSKNVEALTATGAEGKQLNIDRLSKNAWRVQSKGQKEITITYKVYAFELTVRTSFLDASHGYVNGTSLFMFVEGWKNVPGKIKIIPYKDWNIVSTGLPSVFGKKFEYKFTDYDILADSPFEIGNHKVLEFDASGVKHSVAMYGEFNCDEKQLVKDMAKVVESCTDVIGENPNKEYVFIVHNLEKGGGGLEHANSTTLQTSRWSYGTASGYKGFLGLVAHEYFHLWNVKRIRPLQLGPFDYDKENYTSLLWVMEGFTSYYDELLLVKAGFTSEDDFLKGFAGSMASVDNSAGAKVQSAADASFDAWIKYYRPNENSGNSTISYYTKGMVLGAMLDLEIIGNTGGQKCLDDLMRYLYNEYYKKQARGFTEVEFKAAAELIAGKKLDDFFDRYVNSTQPIDYYKFVSYVGYDIKKNTPSASSPQLGISMKKDNGRIIVGTVTAGTSAYEGGLNVNDEIIAIDNYRADDELIGKYIGMKKINDKVKFLVARDGKVQELIITLKANESVKYDFSKKQGASEVQLQAFKKWMYRQ